MNSILKPTTLALLAMSTLVAIGCGKNSQPNNYPNQPYRGGYYPPGNGGSGGVGPGANGQLGPGGVPGDGGLGGPAPIGGVPGGPIGGGVAGGGYGGNQNGAGDWHSWNCSAQNIDVALGTCNLDSDHATSVREILVNKADTNLIFPVWLMWSKSQSRSLQLKSRERSCLKNQLCSADVQQPNYSSGRNGTRQPKNDPSNDFYSTSGPTGNQGQQQSPFQGQGQNQGQYQGQNQYRNNGQQQGQRQVQQQGQVNQQQNTQVPDDESVDGQGDEQENN